MLNIKVVFVKLASNELFLLRYYYPSRFRILVSHHVCLLGRRWSAQTKCTLIVVCKIIAQHIPFLSNLCFLALEIITKLSLLSVNSDVKSLWKLCVHVLIPAYGRTSSMTACLCMCMCVKCCMLLGPHTAMGTGTATYFMVCVWVCVWVCVCVHLELLHVTALVSSYPFTHNDQPSCDTQTQNLSQHGRLPKWDSYGIFPEPLPRFTAKWENDVLARLQSCWRVCVCVL